MGKKVKVMVVDDSAVVRQGFDFIIKQLGDIEMVASASNPYIAANKLKKSIPDVLILDIQMPKMDGITFLKKLMRQHPLPVIICSSLTESNRKLALDALQAGAVEVIQKPQVGVRSYLEESKVVIGDAIRSAAKARVSKKGRSRAQAKAKTEESKQISTPQPRHSVHAVIPNGPKDTRRRPLNTDRVILIGASTGGTLAIEILLKQLPANAPAMAIVQHMPGGFTSTFASRLNDLSAMKVREAQDGDVMKSGQVLIAPGNTHMVLQRSGTRYYVELQDGPLVSRHRPSVDVLFRSGAVAAGKNAVGVILTGMGMDGADGMQDLKEAGARTIAQNKASSTVFGMPGACISRNIIDDVLSLEQIPAKIDH